VYADGWLGELHEPLGSVAIRCTARCLVAAELRGPRQWNRRAIPIPVTQIDFKKSAKAALLSLIPNGFASPHTPGRGVSRGAPVTRELNNVAPIRAGRYPRQRPQ
jgi:hypothetical protein